MKILDNKKKTLFDGEQENLYTKKFQYSCSACECVVSIDPSSLKNCGDLSMEWVDFVSKSIKGVKVINLGEDVFLKVDGLPLKFNKYFCESCKEEVYTFFGVGEYQPSRFMLTVYLSAMVD